jgi:hypothetical protein
LYILIPELTNDKDRQRWDIWMPISETLVSSSPEYCLLLCVFTHTYLVSTLQSTLTNSITSTWYISRVSWVSFFFPLFRKDLTQGHAESEGQNWMANPRSDSKSFAFSLCLLATY